MSSVDPIGQAIHTQLSNEQFTSTGGSTSELDTSKLDGIASLLIDDRAGGTAAATIAVEESDTSGSGFTTLDSAAIVDAETGQPSAFAALSTAASSQRRAIDLTKTKQFLRVTFAGTGISHDVSVTAVAMERRSSDIT